MKIDQNDKEEFNLYLKMFKQIIHENLDKKLAELKNNNAEIMGMSLLAAFAHSAANIVDLYHNKNIKNTDKLFIRLFEDKLFRLSVWRNELSELIDKRARGEMSNERK